MPVYQDGNFSVDRIILQQLSDLPPLTLSHGRHFMEGQIEINLNGKTSVDARQLINAVLTLVPDANPNFPPKE